MVLGEVVKQGAMSQLVPIRVLTASLCLSCTLWLALDQTRDESGSVWATLANLSQETAH